MLLFRIIESAFSSEMETFVRRSEAKAAKVFRKLFRRQTISLSLSSHDGEQRERFFSSPVTETFIVGNLSAMTTQPE